MISRSKKYTAALVQSRKVLLRVLSPRQKDTLKKEFPFRSERDALIRSLKKRGASDPVLSAASGLSPTRIYEITRRKRQNKK